MTRRFRRADRCVSLDDQPVEIVRYRSSAKAGHLQQRPAASVAHLRGEELGVFTHGAAELLNPADGPVEPVFSSTLGYLTEHYGVSPLEWGDVVIFRLQPHWMVAFASNPQQLVSGD